ncbi:hypothetical protein SISNIDRAFT_463110 [Sistotremastrum niveocremeum HHB9708]|uniref:Uncharacterized protein n=1 Tax=Sistotremastrum niveocremeum HHB9708 TaxID=1314777 RepID=A0A164YRB4_9AGAM|nr:hypothetical protein SISNIDRAFT_463110 [Sistotremastrum niveocremeum HHB9708]
MRLRNCSKSQLFFPLAKSPRQGLQGTLLKEEPNVVREEFSQPYEAHSDIFSHAARRGSCSELPKKRTPLGPGGARRPLGLDEKSTIKCRMIPTKKQRPKLPRKSVVEPEDKMPRLSMADFPRFDVKFMLDVGRGYAIFILAAFVFIADHPTDGDSERVTRHAVSNGSGLFIQLQLSSEVDLMKTVRSHRSPEEKGSVNALARSGIRYVIVIYNISDEVSALQPSMALDQQNWSKFAAVTSEDSEPPVCVALSLHNMLRKLSPSDETDETTTQRFYKLCLLPCPPRWPCLKIESSSHSGTLVLNRLHGLPTGQATGFGPFLDAEGGHWG